MRLGGTTRRGVTVALALVVAVHVAMVWGWRFGWSLSFALDKSLAGFVIFHGALALILAGTALPPPHSTRALYAAFAVVSAGALPAPFRYPEITWLKVPMIAAFLVTVALGVRALRTRHQP